MRMVSAKRTLGGENLAPELKKPRQGKAEYYHEGYVDGKLYLVPDSNLEAMKDMINFKMHPRRSLKYKHQTSYDISEYDHFRGKLDDLLEKLDMVRSLTPSEEESTPASSEEKAPSEEPSVEEESVAEEEPEQKPEEEEESIEEEETEEEGETEEEETEEEPKEESINEPLELKPMIVTSSEPGESRLRFLISGHFKEKKNPIYIIQIYEGETSLFKDQKPDFMTSQKEGNIDIYIAGKFYNENILEELNGKPVALNTKPEKILINEETSRVYDDYFEDIYDMKKTNISIKGEFIRSPGLITPLITLGIKQKLPIQSNNRDEYEDSSNKVPTTVLVYKPKYKNPFAPDAEHDGKGDIEWERSSGELHSAHPVTNDLQSLVTTHRLHSGINKSQHGQHLQSQSLPDLPSSVKVLEKESSTSEPDLKTVQLKKQDVVNKKLKSVTFDSLDKLENNSTNTVQQQPKESENSSKPEDEVMPEMFKMLKAIILKREFEEP